MELFSVMIRNRLSEGKLQLGGSRRDGFMHLSRTRQEFELSSPIFSFRSVIIKPPGVFTLVYGNLGPLFSKIN